MHRGFYEAAWMSTQPPAVDLRDRATVAPEGLGEDVVGDELGLFGLLHATEMLTTVEPPAWMDAAASLISISFEGLEETRVEGEVDGLELCELAALDRVDAEFAEWGDRATREARIPAWTGEDLQALARALDDDGGEEDGGDDWDWELARLDRDGNVLTEDSDDGVGGDDWDDGYPDQDDLAPEGLGSGELDWESHDYEWGDCDY
ncbi:MAG: hypothetical protein IT371_23560 [Deltaproteobacteria bacterium]|nr:hypothetical protein [Deltaproteobacteria bacterium]